jgi:hypothetical protein
VGLLALSQEVTVSEQTPSTKKVSGSIPRVSIAGSVRLASHVPLTVQMVQEEEPPRQDWLPVLLIVLLLFGMCYGAAWIKWIHPREHIPATACGPEVPELTVHLSYPRYLAAGDAGQIEISVVNHFTQTLTGTVTLLFDQAPGVHIANKEGTVLHFKELPGGGQVTGRVKFSWNTAPKLINAGSSSFQPWLSLADGRQQKLEIEPPTIAMSPLSYLGAVLGWLRGTVIVAGLGGLFWEQLKKRLFPPD